MLEQLNFFLCVRRGIRLRAAMCTSSGRATHAGGHVNKWLAAYGASSGFSRIHSPAPEGPAVHVSDRFVFPDACVVRAADGCGCVATLN